MGAGTRLKPEANGSLSLPYPQQYKQKALIGLAWRLGGLVVMESPDARLIAICLQEMPKLGTVPPSSKQQLLCQMVSSRISA